MTPLPINARVKTDCGIGLFLGMVDGKYKVMINRADWNKAKEYPRPFTEKSPTVNVTAEKVEKA
jgi:hypothetical protein